MKRRLFRLVVTMLALCSGTAFASIPSTSEHVLRTEPMIVGTVVAVGDRKLIVDTDQNEQVTLMMDSRTMLPIDLEPGMVMRAEFKVMEDGRYYVSRVVPIRDGEDETGAAYRSDRYETSSAERRISARPVYERRYRASEYNRDHEATSRSALISGDEQRSRMATNYDDMLPQTAGDQSLIGLLGLIALGASGVLVQLRRPRH